jgi:hypothetical protein
VITIGGVHCTSFYRHFILYHLISNSRRKCWCYWVRVARDVGLRPMGRRGELDPDRSVEEQVGLQVTIFILFGRCRLPISAGTQTILTDNYRGFPHSLQVNYELVYRLSHDHLLPNPMRSLFIITLYAILFSYWKIHKTTRKRLKEVNRITAYTLYMEAVYFSEKSVSACKTHFRLSLSEQSPV